jgi:hypothetical protein
LDWRDWLLSLFWWILPSQTKARSRRCDVSFEGFPEVSWYAQKIRDLINDNYSKVKDIIGVARVRRVTVIFKATMDHPAASYDGHIDMNLEYYRSKNYGDEGSIIHELTHVLQRCPIYDDTTIWLIEGMADYVRDKLGYEEEWSKAHYEPGRAKAGYQTTAHFLIYLEERWPGTFMELSLLLVNGEYSPDAFEDITGESLADLISDYEATNT